MCAALGVARPLADIPKRVAAAVVAVDIKRCIAGMRRCHPIDDIDVAQLVALEICAYSRNTRCGGFNRQNPSARADQCRGECGEKSAVGANIDHGIAGPEHVDHQARNFRLVENL